ncbi:Bax inhibitor-1/YccA family protein [soil metagenome]|jgi:modulator of FtsH protease
MGVAYSGALVRSGEDRATLVRRTYGLVFAGVIVTAIGVAFGQTQPGLMQAVVDHPWITLIAMFAPLWMAMRARGRPIQGLGLSFVFTFVAGIMIAPMLYVAERTTPGITLQAGVLTMTAFGVLSLYAAVSKRDFKAWGTFFIVGLVVLVVTSLLNIFIQSTAASLWISAATVLVFSGLLVFDTWRILRSGQYGPDDYVPAALNIYLDLLNMFLAIVNLLGGGRRR